MQQALEFLLHHIELVVFLTVLAEQAGLPIPAVPVLLAAGAVADDGLNRRQVVTYQDTSTATYTWDNGNRMTRVVDTSSGTVTRAMTIWTG